MKKIVAFVFALVLLVPLVMFADDVQPDPNVVGNQDVGGILAVIYGLLRYVIPILITAAVVFFIWGVIGYMVAKDEEKKKVGRSRIINGLIAILVIVAFWGILRIVMKTVNLGTGLGGKDIVPCTPYYLPDGTLVQNC